MTRSSLVLLPFVFLVACSGDEETVDEDSGTTDATSEAAPDTFAPDTATDDTADSGAPSDSGADSTVVDGDAMETASDTSVDSTTETSAETSVDGATDTAIDGGSDVAAEADAAPPSPEIWAVRVGDGSTALGSDASLVAVERYRLSDKSHLGTISFPSVADEAGTSTFTLTGASFYEGMLTRSRDGRYATVAGYLTPIGFASPAFTPGTSVSRVIARIDAAGTVDMSTTTSSVSKNPWTVSSIDGSQYWLGSANGASGGIRYMLHGSSGGSSSSVTPTGTRSLALAGDQLFGAGPVTDLHVFEFPAPPPTSSATPTALPGLPGFGGFNGLALFARSGPTIDTLYVCRDASTAAIEKWTKSGTDWSLAKGFDLSPAGADAGALQGCTGLAAEVIDGKVTLVAATMETPSRIVTLVDDGTASPTVTTLATSGTNQVFRGVSFAPHP